MLKAKLSRAHSSYLHHKRLCLPALFAFRGGPIHVACEHIDGKLSTEQEERPNRKAVIIKKASKATQTRASRLRSSPQESENRLKDLRETLEWYFSDAWPRDKAAVLRFIYISRGHSGRRIQRHCILSPATAPCAAAESFLAIRRSKESPAPLDLILSLKRLRRIFGKASKEEERDLVLKALAKSDMLEISENGLRIQRKDTQGESVAMMIVVAVALLNDRGEVLMAQRRANQSFPGKWEFPGGKVDPYETPEGALSREIEEELNIKVDQQDLQPLIFGSHLHGSCHILMPLFLCTRWSGEVEGNEGQEIEWCSMAELRRKEMPPGNLPLVAAIERAVHQHAQSILSIAS